MLKKKNTFKDFIQGNGFYVLTAVALIAIVVTAIVLPKKGQGNVAQEPDKYAPNRETAAEDISDLRVPTIEPRIDDDFAIVDEVETEQGQDLHSQVPSDALEDEVQEDLLSETFSSTTPENVELFHGDEELFEWPIEEQIIYNYSDNDIGSSFMNPTLDRTMRSFGLFLKAEEQDKVKVAAKGEVLSIVQYPTDDTSRELDYPQVGTAIIIDHGNNWKTVYGLHTGEATVTVGDFLEAGDVVGTVGMPSQDFVLTGTNLYFQVLKHDVPVNPKDMLK